MLCFDKMNIYSDIVLGDPHGIDGVDRENGESLVLARTSLGEEIITGALQNNDITLREASLEQAIAGQGIELKRKKFNANIRAWEELGNKSPTYPDEVLEYSIEASKEEIAVAKKRITHSIRIDKYESEEEVIEEANRYFNNKTKKKNVFSKIKNFLRGK